jgi:hypothetical protein
MIRSVRSARAPVLALGLLAPLGCSREAPPAPAAAARSIAAGSIAPVPASASASASARAVSAAASADAASAPARLCEVEISGQVRLSPKDKDAPDPLVFVALGDCLDPASRIVGFGGTAKGRFFVEVFVPWGSDLTVCAASESSPGGPSTLYGKAKVRMHAERAGEIEYKGVGIDLAKGPARTFEHRAGP